MGRAAVHLRPWRPGDQTAFIPRPGDAEEGGAQGWDWSVGPPGPTWSLIRYPGEVIGVAGGVPDAKEPDAFQVWACLTQIPRGDWALLLLCATAAIRHLERSHGARRLTALVRKNAPPFERTLERLGFTRSTEASCWPGYIIMSKGR